MSWRFHRRVKVCKGIWVNVAKTGASLSAGGRGITTNLNRKGMMGTVGLPGSGLSYRTRRYPYTIRPAGPKQVYPRQKTVAQRVATGLAWAAWLSIIYFIVAYVLYYLTGGR